MNLIKVNVLPTMITNLEDDSAWCPTFQLIWNDLVDEVVKKDVEFINDKDNQMVIDLNQKTFKSNMLSDEYYYKKYGFATPKLRDEIKSAIKEKFDEDSDILDSFTFDARPNEENSSPDVAYLFGGGQYTTIESLDLSNCTFLSGDNVGSYTGFGYFFSSSDDLRYLNFPV